MLFDYWSFVGCLESIHFRELTFDYFQCQYLISFTCSTERGGVRAKLTVVFVSERTNKRHHHHVYAGVSVNVSLSVFVLFLYGTNSSVHPSTSSIFCLVYIYDKYRAVILHSKSSSSTCKMINVKAQDSWLLNYLQSIVALLTLLGARGGV